MGAIKKIMNKGKSKRKIKNNQLSILEKFPVLHLLPLIVVVFTCILLLVSYLPSSPAPKTTRYLPYEHFEQKEKVATSSATLSEVTQADYVEPQVPVTTDENSFCLEVPIILYHHIQPMADAIEEEHAQLTVDSVIFDEQMKYLVQAGYHSLSVAEVVDALRNKTILPEKSIVITIDDGYLDNYTYGFQILKKYNLKGNFMIPTGLIMNPGYMTWDNVREIRNSTIGYIYNHTWSHSALGYQNKEKIDSELSISKMQFVEQIGDSPNILTYPYGSFSPIAVQELRAHGFIAGLTTIPGRTQCDDNIMTLYRDHIGNAPLSLYGL